MILLMFVTGATHTDISKITKRGPGCARGPALLRRGGGGSGSSTGR